MYTLLNTSDDTLINVVQKCGLPNIFLKGINGLHFDINLYSGMISHPHIKRNDPLHICTESSITYYSLRRMNFLESSI